MTLQRKIDAQKVFGPERARPFDASQPSEFPIPLFGEHDLVPAKNPNVWEPAVVVR